MIPIKDNCKHFLKYFMTYSPVNNKPRRIFFKLVGWLVGSFVRSLIGCFVLQYIKPFRAI